jgi:ribosomal protein S18 acetylase RimI-like enzyme
MAAKEAAETAAAAGAGLDAGVMARVTANFRQYLMGWGDAERVEGDREDLDLYRSGLATPQFNGVVRVRSLDAVGPAVAAARARLAGVPWWWWVGPDSPPDTAAALAGHGAAELVTLPLMVRSLDTLPDHDRGTPLAGLRLERAERQDRLRELVRTYSTSMGVDRGLESDLVRIEARRPDNAAVVRLAAVLGGSVVGTTVVIAAHGVAGIFLVHVAEAHRRRGVGKALTTAALRVGRERGMRLAALTSSAAGEPLYRELGFTTVSEYRLFGLPA